MMSLTPVVASVTNSTGILLVDKVIDAYTYAFGGTLLLMLFVIGVFIYMAIKNNMDRTALGLGFVLLGVGLYEIMGLPMWVVHIIGVIAGMGLFIFILKIAGGRK